MPTFAHACCFVAVLFFPALFAILDILCIWTKGQDDVVLFHLLLQIGIIFWFFLTWLEPIKKVNDYFRNINRQVELI